MPVSPAEFNRPLLEAVTAKQWWFRAKKTKPIWAKMLKAPQTVQTLEGPQEAPVGAYLCRGEAGDIWPQEAERLLSKYVATDELSADGWRKFLPNLDSEGVLAAQIDQPFSVLAAWGVLQGQPGDYLVKNFQDRDVANPADVWIVSRFLFEATYERVADSLT